MNSFFQPQNQTISFYPRTKPLIRYNHLFTKSTTKTKITIFQPENHGNHSYNRKKMASIFDHSTKNRRNY